MTAADTRRAPRARSRHLPFLLTLVLLVGILYFAKAVIVPLALAFLLTFILTPLVVQVQRWGVPRVPAVLIVVVTTVVLCGLVGWGVGAQVTKLADDLPSHANMVKAKIWRLRSHGAGPFSRVFEAFQGIGDVAKKPPSESDAAAERTVVVAQPATSALDRLEAVAAAVLEPVATAGLILILVIFILINREDLRNRLIGILGHGQLTGTTRIFVESAERISRLLLMQLIVNAAFGLIFGLALLIIGVPYWLLWGFLTLVLRFVPFIGSWIAASLPVLLSFAISPGWTPPLVVLGVFVALDLVTSNVVEPLAFGHSTGVSPLALLVAAVFWTWVWGPVGLVLSTPLTVCLVVLGQHVPRLRFLSLLLGDRPALLPHVAYYQRLLAGDFQEAQLIAAQYGAEKGAQNMADDLLVPALRLARRDRLKSGLRPEDETFVLDSTDKLLDLLATGPVSATEDASPRSTVSATVMGCPAHVRGEELILHMVADLLDPSVAMERVTTRELPAEIEARIERQRPEALFIAILPPGGVTQARYLCRRLRRRFKELKIVVGYFGRVRDFDRLLVRFRSAGASYVTTSVLQSRQQLRSLLAAQKDLPAALPENHFVDVAPSPSAAVVS